VKITIERDGLEPVVGVPDLPFGVSPDQARRELLAFFDAMLQLALGVKPYVFVGKPVRRDARAKA
jgi:hypothetical protein